MKEQGQFHEETQQLVEEMKAGATAMVVAVRVRPLTAREATADPNETARVLDSKMIVLLDASGEEGERGRRSREAQFCFDFVYDKQATTKEIYDQALSGLLDGILDGFNSTILAYGATGCGKTYTMIGDGGREGISALTMIDLLGRAAEMRRHKNVLIRVAYIEIYNEVIKDLLVSEDKNLDLREDPKEGMQIPGVTEIAIASMLELATVLKVGAANRSKEATVSNEVSSRSHSLLLVKAESREKAQGVREETCVGKLSLVDLAGSERAAGGKGGRQLEGARINKSLLALGNCIQVLAESGSRSGFVPWRESKLTRLLKESLGGNCRTAMIVNISPFAGSWEETHNSLIYASRAKNIRTTASRNVLAAEAHLGNYVALIGNLKRENDDLKKQLRSNNNHSLPHLKALPTEGSEKLELNRMQSKIDSHFAQELKILQVLSELTVKLDRAGFKLYRLQLEAKREEKGRRGQSKEREKAEKAEAKLSKTIEELSEQRQQFEGKLEELVFERGSLMAEVRSGEFSQSSGSLLVAHYREKKVEVELEEIRLREGRLEGEREEKERLVGALGEQLRLRDRIIEDQRLLIQKNNIINRITYSKLALAPASFPDIFQALSQPHTALLPRDKSENLSLFQEKNINKEKPPEDNSPKHSLSKKKPKNPPLFEVNQEGSFERVVSTELEMQGKRSLGRGGKVVRTKSKRKNAQLDFVYMQR